MPYDRKAYMKTYRQNNKEKLKQQRKEYYAKNKEKGKQQTKEYRENNFHKTRILDWKRQGIIDGDFPLLNEVFEKETHCWICWKPYNGRKIRKCLDHDWSIKDDSNPRYICCHSCNVHVVG